MSILGVDSGTLGVGGWALVLPQRLPGKGVEWTLATEARNQQRLSLIFQQPQDLKK